MKVGDLVKDNFYQRTGIISKVAVNRHTSREVYLIVFLDDGRNFRSKEKWLEPAYFKRIS